MFLAVDYGTKRIGLALGKIMPRGAGVIEGKMSREEIYERIAKICRDEDVEAIILGMPYRSQGEEGTIAGQIHSFKEELGATTGLPVYLEPEQFTSVEATEQIKKLSQRQVKKGDIDELSAILLLEQFLANREES